MNLLYLEIALLINKKLYEEKVILDEVYEKVDNEIYKRMRCNGII